MTQWNVHEISLQKVRYKFIKTVIKYELGKRRIMEIAFFINNLFLSCVAISTTLNIKVEIEGKSAFQVKSQIL